jgi:lipoyl(octanoyl) transferase
MILDVLPERTDGAAGNMAADFLLLQRYPGDRHARFRAYGWHRPAFTFGFSQKIAWVRAQLAEVGPVEVCRRPSGGGLVDHREDWTYALVIPRHHPLYAARAIDSYRAVHGALLESLQALGADVELCTSCGDDRAGEGGAGVCSRRPEIHDVVRRGTGLKVAGAAQKRNKHGLLLQGSIWRPAAGALEWMELADALAARLAAMLQAESVSCGWPEFAEDELAGLSDHYASPEWIEQR